MRALSDRWLGAALCGLAIAYVAALPRTLGESDEGLLLYETVRLLRGEVYFRDVFDFIPPGAHAYYALLFAIFGSSIDSARIGTALLHGGIVLAVFHSCRRLGVRAVLAAVAALAPLAVAQPAWPYASAHWLSAALVMLFLLRALAPGGLGRAAVLGAQAGLIAAVHQQKGVVFLICGAALLTLEHGLAWRYRGRMPAADLLRPLAALVAGCAGVVVPFFGGLVLWAGLGPTWTALIEFPLTQYAGFHRVSWGQVTPLSAHLAAYTSPILLAALPLALLPVAWRAATRIRRGADAEASRRLAAFVVVAGSAILSVRYNADFIHLAFIAPLMLVAAAVDLEWAVAILPAPEAGQPGRASLGEPHETPTAGSASLALPRAPRPARNARFLGSGALQVGVNVGLALAVAVQMGRNLVRARGEYPVVADTAFGRIAVRNADVETLVDAVRRHADAAPSRQVFVYPTYPALYLMTGTDNPTPFQILVSDYSPPAAFEAAIAALERSQAPLVVVLEALVPANDLLMPYVRAHYDRDRAGSSPALGTVGIYRRRSE